MDLNYVYQRRGISLRNAQTASCELSRQVHLELAARDTQIIANAKVNGTVECRK